jgi:ribosomal protein S12 methylthiotransferase
MELQQEISRQSNQARIGEKMRVIIDRKDEDFYFGRSEFDSYEVDPEVLISCQNFDLQIGQMCNVEVTDVEDYDLFAIVV